MTDEPRTTLTLPSYGEGTLADLASSLLASLGIVSEPNPLGLPETARVCLLIVDGLGWELLRDHPAAAPFLSELALRVSEAADGEDAVRQVLAFGQALSEATSRP